MWASKEGEDASGSCRRTAQPCSLHPSPSGALPLRAAGRPFGATRWRMKGEHKESLRGGNPGTCLEGKWTKEK